jgi:hypothetical protein
MAFNAPYALNFDTSNNGASAREPEPTHTAFLALLGAALCHW